MDEVERVSAAAGIVAIKSAHSLTADEVITRVTESNRTDTDELLEFADILAGDEDYGLISLNTSAVKMLFDLMAEYGLKYVRDILRNVVEKAKAKSTASRKRAAGDLLGALEEDFAASRKQRFSTQQDGAGREKGYAPWSPQKKTKVILAQVKEILEHYEAELPLTARQIFYRLVGAYGYPKDENAYERLTNYLLRARRARVIKFSDIRDDGAAVMEEKHYSGEEAFYAELRAMGERYERDKLATQERDIRVYCEAAGMMPQLRRVTRRYSVPVYSCSGFDSLTAKYDLAESVSDAHAHHGRPTVILHLGDMDPSGETIFDAISEDVYAFLEVDTTGTDPQDVAVFERVALTEELVAEYDLPTDPAKESSHSAGWGARRACQLEALAPDVLAGVLGRAIEKHLDLNQLEADRVVEKEERRNIAGALLPPQEKE